jgi:hypothetical protein
MLTTVPAQGATVTGKLITAAKANNGTVVETPFGSTSYQATYQRPIYKNVFKDCTIQKDDAL